VGYPPIFTPKVCLAPQRRGEDSGGKPFQTPGANETRQAREASAMNLILTGLRGTGKTNIGRRLALVLQRPFFDTDQLIEQHIGEAITPYVGRMGWEAFRDVEHQVLCQMGQLHHAVISTGGGALTYERNVAVLKPTGLVILLAAEPLALARRLARSYARPALTTEDSLEAEMSAVWASREPLYRKVCDVVLHVDDETLDEEADLRLKVAALVDLLRPFLGEGMPHMPRESWPHHPG
jgi:shikimate kinase